MRTTIWDDFKMYVLNSGNVLNKLLAINITVFIFYGLIWMIEHLFLFKIDYEYLLKYQWFGLPGSVMNFLYKPWTIVTYQFEHEGFFHLLNNMIMLFVAGRIFREFLGDKKLLNVYLLGGIAGGIMFMLAMNVIPMFGISNTIIIGASASAMAILTAAATLVPNYTLFLVLIGPVRLVYIMLFFFLVDLLSLATSNGGGHFSHLGGALFGFVYIRLLQKGTDIGAWLTRFLDWAGGIFKPKPKNMRVRYRNAEPQPATPHKVTQDEIDDILDKIARSGYDSLSQREKDILFRASKDN